MSSAVFAGYVLDSDLGPVLGAAVINAGAGFGTSLGEFVLRAAADGATFLAQVTEPAELWRLGLRAEDFDVVALKSRVHFRRGFDDSGFARTILLVEPDQPFLGTVRLDALPYRNLRVAEFYPFGGPDQLPG